MFLFLIFLLLLTNLVIPPNIWAASTSCSMIYQEGSARPPTVFQRNTQILRELNNISIDFSKLLVKRQAEGKIDSSEFKFWVQKIELKTEEYLTSAQIRYEKKNEKIQNITDQYVALGADFELPMYQILGGGMKGDFIAGMLKGALESKKLVGLKIYLDPYLYLTSPDTDGAFSPRSFQLILTPFALMKDALGVGSVFRHEIQHVFEYIKLKNGEMTLSSFQGSREILKEGPYTNFMSMDELETHLRDLRFLMNIASTRDRYLADEIFMKVMERRKVQIQEDLKTIQSLILKSNFILDQLKNVLKTQQPPNFSAIEGNYRVSTYRANAGGDFEFVTFKSTSIKEKDFQSAMLKQIEWAQRRIEEIVSEVQVISKSAN